MFTHATSVSQSTTISQNKVLRNTYMLLALSLIPTVLGTWVGIETGILKSMGTVMSLIVFFAGAFGLMFLIEKNKNSSAGVGLLLLFTFFMGVMLSNLVGSVLGTKNGTELVMISFAGTAGIFFAMSMLATTIKKDLSGMHKFLFVGVLLLVFAGIVNVFLQSTMLMLVLSTISVGIFSAFLLYDTQRIINGGETNYISATLGIYLSLFNIFQSLLSILGIFNNND